MGTHTSRMPTATQLAHNNCATMTVRSLIVLATILAHASSSTPAQPKDPPMCGADFSSKGTSFDLTRLKEMASNANPGEVADRVQKEKGDYKYTFAVCSTIAAPTVCQTSNNDNDNTCFYLGNSEASGGKLEWYDEYTSWALLDEEDPALGVSLTYTGGQHCTHTDQFGERLRRKITFNFRCRKMNGIESFEKQVIDETDQCGYQITVDSPYACPTQCGFGGDRVACGNHGVCGFDTDLNQSRCLCNEGYTGSGCGDKVKKDDNDYGAILGLLIFVVIALVAFGAAFYFLFRWMQNRTMRMDGESYSKLEGMYGDSLAGTKDDSFEDHAPPRMGVSTGPSNI